MASQVDKMPAHLKKRNRIDEKWFNNAVWKFKKGEDFQNAKSFMSSLRQKAYSLGKSLSVSFDEKAGEIFIQSADKDEVKKTPPAKSPVKKKTSSKK